MREMPRRSGSTAGLVASVLLAAALSGCSTMQITTDYDVGMSFGGYKTWAWAAEPRPRSGDPYLDSDLLDKRVRRAVERELPARGYQQIGSGADFLVDYHVALENRVQVRAIGSPYGYGPGDWELFGAGGIYARTYDEGSLILDFVDAKSNELVWRGIARAEVYMSDGPEERERKVNEAVRRILERFPPG
jgi:hypothetical protein